MVTPIKPIGPTYTPPVLPPPSVEKVTIEPSTRLATPENTKNSRPEIRFVKTLEETRKLCSDFDLSMIDLCSLDIAKAQESITKAIRESAKKATEQDGWLYYQTVANIVAGGIGLALFIAGSPTSMASGAAIMGYSASSLFTTYLQKDDTIKNTLALVLSGLSLLSHRAITKHTSLTNFVIATLAIVEATSIHQRHILDSQIEQLKAEQTKHEFAQKIAKRKTVDINTTMQDAAKHHANAVESVRKIIEMIEMCKTHILLEV